MPKLTQPTWLHSQQLLSTLIHCLRYWSMLAAKYNRCLNNKTTNLYILLMFINDTDKECLWIYACSSKRKWFYSCKILPTTELQKNFKFLAYKTLPKWTPAIVATTPGTVFYKPLCPGHTKTQAPHISTHFIFFATLEYFKKKIKHYFLIMHFLTFSSPLYAQKHPRYALL